MFFNFVLYGTFDHYVIYVSFYFVSLLYKLIILILLSSLVIFFIRICLRYIQILSILLTFVTK